MTNEDKLLEELKRREEERRLREEEDLRRRKAFEENELRIKQEREERERVNKEEREKREKERVVEREKEEKEREKRLEQQKKEEEAQEKLRKKYAEREVRRLLKNVSNRMSGSLQEIGATGVNTHSGTMPVYYVIVGRGPAAIINHTTLRQTEFGKKRIAGLPVMHVGFANPWTKYMQHGMGQPPRLLNLPGFEKHPDDITHDAGLDSKHFGQCVEDEYNRLESRYGEKVLTEESWVVWIQSKSLEKMGNDTEDELEKDGMPTSFLDIMVEKLAEKFQSETAYFRVLVMKPKPANELKKEDLLFIYASNVDICTGPGRPIVIPPGKGDTDECKKARTAAWLSPETWTGGWGEELKARKVLNGVDSIRDEITWTANERVCVTAGGGVGLNAAERARNNDCKLDWFGRNTLMETFANPRNDTILRHPTANRLLIPGESRKPPLVWTQDDQIIPCKNDLRYGYGAALDKTELVNTKVKVTLKVADAKKATKIKDYFNEQVGFSGTTMWDFSPQYKVHINQEPSELYDRLVIPNGQASKALGHAYYFARHLRFFPITIKLGQMIGLGTLDKRIRVLGAAAQTYDNYGVLQRKATMDGEKMWLYWDSLPVSAVPDGFIFSGANIALANEFFSSKKPNKNVTTASQDEMLEILMTKFGYLDSELIAKIIVDKRRRPDNNGFESMDKVIEALRNDDEAKKIASLDSIIGLLDVSYTKSIADDLLVDV